MKSKIFNAMSYFFLWVFASSFFSYYLKDSLHGSLKYLFYFFVFLLSAYLFRLIASKSSLSQPAKFLQHYFKSPYSLISFVFYLLFFVSLFASSFGVFQYFTGVEQLAKWDDPSFNLPAHRIYSFLGNPNLLAGFLLMLIPINFGLAYGELENLKTPFSKIILPILLLGLSLNAFALFLTGSRAAILTYSILFALLGFSFLLVLILRLVKLQGSSPGMKLFSFLLFFLLIPLILAQYFEIGVFDRMKTLVKGAAYSTSLYRLEVWAASFEIIKENWILGVGLGNDVFRKVNALYMKPGFEALSPYSIYLQVFIETGILGLLLFLTVLQNSIRVLLRVIKVNLTISLTILFSLLGILMHGFFDTVFFRPPIFSVFCFLIAAVAALESQMQEQKYSPGRGLTS